MTFYLREGQAKLTLRVAEIEARLEQLKRQHLKALGHVHRIRGEIDDLKYELTPLKNGLGIKLNND